MKLKTLAIVLLALLYGFSSATANVVSTEELSTLNCDKDDHEDDGAELISNDHDDEDEDDEDKKLIGCDKDDHEDDEDKKLSA
jgi:hypothetical protein